MTFENAARVVQACDHQVEPDPAENGATLRLRDPVPEWRWRLVCSSTGSHDVDMVVAGQRLCLRLRKPFALAGCGGCGNPARWQENDPDATLRRSQEILNGERDLSAIFVK